MSPDEKNKRPKTGRVARLDKRIARALNHPLRTEIIAILNDRCASPREMADLLGEELSSVSYHTKELLKLECIEVADRQQVRGAVKTRYRATTRMLLDTPEWELLDKTVRTGISINAVNEVTLRASAAVEAGTFDRRTDRTIITMKMDVDDQGWQDAQEALRVAYERLGEIEVETAARKAKGASTFRMTASLLGYESPTDDDGES
ncbi:MAG TPA: winged helix-turn-helix domain-containing protein [Solirubrobacterales bacterium]|nr:winged helix-turn-helix domain-containing protein [Solirubrobacterales bacterium]